MSEPRKTIGSMHFGPFDLSPELSELRKHGQRLKLSGQAIDVLLMLASNAGRLVTREDLQRKLWPGDSFGDFEHGLNAAVNRLRETLGDSATDPIYIETVPRRGYRFIAQVDQVPNTADPAVPDNAVELGYQHAADFRVDLKQLKRDTDSSSTHTVSAADSVSSSAAVSSTQVRPSSGAVLLAEARRHKSVLALMLVVLAALTAGLGIYFSG
jgi:DNA-binding winged helix-turn-helix (wHTH) protein